MNDIRERLKGAIAELDSTALEQAALDEIERLRVRINGYADANVELRAALKVAQQAILEFSHAQECGPSWYTRGESRMYSQVRLWLRRGLEAVQGALGPYDDNGQYLKEKTGAEPTEPTADERPQWPPSRRTIGRKQPGQSNITD